jgi:hypothetical protein
MAILRQMKRALLSAAVGLVVAGGASVTSASAAPPEPCRNTYGGDVISAKNVGCKRARDLVRTWAVRTRRTGEPDRTVFRFRCRLRVVAVEGQTMRCRRGAKRVRWYVNLPQ